VHPAGVRCDLLQATDEIQRDDWLEGVQRIGITAGASTPNNKIGEAIERVLHSKGLAVPA
jgi:4-hydroxy-3-methylbut-2-enyl diphosphate reductase